jgi:ABC-type dipeptide/oligopeptide/nickel transport system permease subunit
MTMQALRRHPLLAFAVAFIVVQLLVAIFADWIAPYDPVAQDVIARMKGPSAAHWLGTDQFGRDILSRIIHGWRSSLAVPTTTISAPSAATRSRFTPGASDGMTTTAAAPSSRAARATPWA